MKPIIKSEYPAQRTKPEPSAPLGDSPGVADAGFFSDPADNFLVVGPSFDELFEFCSVNTGKVEKYAVERTVIMIRSSAPCKFSPAFVQRPRGNNTVWAERSPSTAGSEPCQVRSERQNSFVYHL